MSNAISEEKPKIRLAASLILFQKKVNLDSYDILMMKRSNNSSFNSVTVFPGGALDKVDNLNNWKNFNFSKNITNSEEDKLTSLKLTAIRETFEEAGILLTKPKINLNESEVKQWREKLEADSLMFVEMCKYYKVEPDVDSLYYVSHWVSPKIIQKDFSTYFFAYLSPNPIPFHLPNTEGSLRELCSLEYNTPSNWLKLQRDQVLFYPPQFYMCSVLENNFSTWNSIKLHLNTPPVSEYKSMISNIQLLDANELDLPALGIDPEKCDALYYHIYPGDFQYNKNLDDVHYDPLLNVGKKLNPKLSYHRILGIIEGLQMRDVMLITNLNVVKGRFLAYDDHSNNTVNLNPKL